jgi:hypothetical protein
MEVEITYVRPAFSYIAPRLSDSASGITSPEYMPRKVPCGIEFLARTPASQTQLSPIDNKTAYPIPFFSKLISRIQGRVQRSDNSEILTVLNRSIKASLVLPL